MLDVEGTDPPHGHVAKETDPVAPDPFSLLWAFVLHPHDDPLRERCRKRKRSAVKTIPRANAPTFESLSIVQHLVERIALIRAHALRQGISVPLHFRRIRIVCISCSIQGCEIQDR